MCVCVCVTETDMFFLAVSMVGTDFSMIGQLFPHRARSEIKVTPNFYIFKATIYLLTGTMW